MISQNYSSEWLGAFRKQAIACTNINQVLYRHHMTSLETVELTIQDSEKLEIRRLARYSEIVVYLAKDRPVIFQLIRDYFVYAPSK